MSSLNEKEKLTTVFFLICGAIAAIVAFLNDATSLPLNVQQMLEKFGITSVVNGYPPCFTEAFASSQLEDQVFEGDGSFTYEPKCILDDSKRTAWNEGVDGPGLGQWIRVSASSLQHVSGMSIRNGYPLRKSVYYNNNRPKDLTIILSDGHEINWTLDDLYDEWQDITFDTPHDIYWIKIVIQSVYEGKIDDTCISSIKAF